MIVPTLARMLIREHIHRPIKGRVLTLGRQTIAMNYEQLIQLLEQENFSISDQVLKDIKIKYDNQTRVGKKNTDFISDEVFFNLLGVKQLSVMDVSEYESADILHDLNKPIPASLEGQFDFIIDGGTFDHLLDLRVAFENVVKMLKTGGRVFQWNAASNFTGDTYLSFSPDFFYDYYTLNKFTDCKVYLVETDVRGGQREPWDVYEFSGTKYRYFHSKRILMVIVLAEKGANSTYDGIPIQSQYRDDHILQIYKDGQKAISLSDRKPYKGSELGMKINSSEINKPVRKSIFNKVVSKYKEKGLAWVFYKCLNNLNPFSRKPERREVEGYRYVGKI